LGKTEKSMPAQDTGLLVAMEVGDVESCRVFVKGMTLQNVNYQTITRNTALHSAVRFNLVDVARMLLEAGADMMTMPRMLNTQNYREMPLWMAFKMGESRVEMQILFLETIAAHVTEPMYSNVVAKMEIEKILHETMLYSTPLVFFRAKELFPDMKKTNMYGLTPLMYTLRRVSLYEQNRIKYTSQMEHVMKIVERYPLMLWERFSLVDVEKGIKTVCQKEGSTALGMLLFETIVSRKLQNDKNMADLLRIEKLHESTLNILADCMPNTAIVSHMYVVNERQKLKTKIMDRNTAAITFFTKTLSTSYLSLMVKPLHLAMLMGLHPRLGNNYVDKFGVARICGIKTLNCDIVKTIFETYVLGIRDDEEKFRNLLH